MIPRECKRLAEVDFPIAAVSKHAAREKSIRHGHPSTLHLWWARRPLASSRAVLIALLLPDPCDEHCPEAFRKEARELLPKIGCGKGETDQEVRRGLLKFIADFANWDLAANRIYLDVSRALVKAAHGEEPPLVVDPFSGGGSIPLEALRLGCDAFASDLNPVACLILKVMLEDIPRHGPGLAKKLRKVGGDIKQQAERELTDLYPTDPDGATPIAYLWARTVRCEAPNCGAEIPLMRSFWLCKKPKRKRALRHRVVRPRGAPPRVEFKVFEPKTEKDVHGGTVTRAKATCLCCGVVLPPERVRSQLAAQRGGADVIFDEQGNRTGGARMTAVVTLKPGRTGRHYRLPTGRDYEAVRKAQKRVARILEEWERGGKQGLCPVPDEPLPPIGTLGFRVQRYGMLQWGDLFTARQKVALVTIGQTVRALPKNLGDSIESSIATGIDRTADYNSANCRWVSHGEFIGNTFTRQALPIVWDFAEVNPVADSTGSFLGAIDWVAKVIEAWPNSTSGQFQSADAAEHPLPDQAAWVWFADPPYYDAIPYADLSDFFLVWLKRTLPGHPLLQDPFDPDNPLSPKTPEAVQDETKQVGGRPKNRQWFEETMAKAFAEGRRVLQKGWHRLRRVCSQDHRRLGGTALRHDPGRLDDYRFLADCYRDGLTPPRPRLRRSRHQRPSHLPPAPRKRAGGRMGRCPAGASESRRRLDGALAGRRHPWRGPCLRLHRSGAWRFSAATVPWRPPRAARSAYRSTWKRSGRLLAVRRSSRCSARRKRRRVTALAGALEEDARLTALFLWTLQSTETFEENGKNEEKEREAIAKAAAKGFNLPFDVVRRFAQPMGIDLDRWTDHIIGQEKGVVRLLPVAERARELFGEDGARAPPPTGSRATRTPTCSRRSSLK